MDIIEKAKLKLNQEVLEIENRTDLTEEEKITQIVTVFSTSCAAIAVQPIPFADIFILTPIQALMGKRLLTLEDIIFRKLVLPKLLKKLEE